MIDQPITHYKILDKLGEGGMGVVYKAEDTKLHRTVALKFLPSHLVSDKKAKERFLHEAQAASKLDHPNICTVHEIGETPDHGLFIVMPYYEGETLKEKISRGPLPLKEAVDIITQIANGLSKAHSNNIVHRDIKPGNIIITTDGIVKIVDFGLAKLSGAARITMTGTTIGTIAYMSPEQAMGGDVDRRSDIWSLGIMFYEMLTGQLPFEGDYDQAVIYRIINEEPEPASESIPELQANIDILIGKTLEKNPENRYQDVKELIKDIENIKNGNRIGSYNMKIVRRKIPHRKRVRLYGGLIILLVLVVLAVTILMQSSSERTIDSIAVLPLKNLSNDPEQEYFVEGIQDALITQLSKISALKIISRTSTMPYKNTNKTMPQIAHELGVNGLIEASVQRSGDSVRITAQLINGPADRHIWAQEFDRPVKDIFTLQSEIAQTIAKEIKVAITSQEKSNIVTKHIINPRAQEAYFKASFLLRKLTADGIVKAYAYLQTAIVSDSNWAPPYALMADWYILNIYMGLPPSEVYPKARTMAEKAIDLDPTLAQAYFELGEIDAYDRDWQGLDKNFRQGLGFNPNSASGHEQYATWLSSLGRHEEALNEARLAIQLDPVSNYTRGQFAMVLTRAHMFNEAIKQAMESINLDPKFEVGYFRLAWALWGAGRYDEAVSIMRKARRLFSKSKLPWKVFTAELYAYSGRKDSARRLLGEIKHSAGERYLPANHIASIYVGLGEMDEALRWLWRAYDSRDPDLLGQITNPQFDKVRDDPRIQELLKRMNVPQSAYTIVKN